jgi:hypothetical protein
VLLGRRPSHRRIVDDELLARAHARSGLLLPAEVGGVRAGRRRGLVVVQPRVLAAETQPLGPVAVVRAVELSVVCDYWFAGRAALWLHGAGRAPRTIDVGVRDTRQLVLAPPVRVRRLARSLLRATRTVGGHQVVGLETAVVQSAEDPEVDVLAVVEDVLRRRATTFDRLLRTCRRGVAGSAALRRALGVVDDGDLELLKRRLRSALVSAGVAGLRSEVPVHSASGAAAYLDLLHEASGNAVEVDGWQTHTERRRFVADRRRDRWVRREHGVDTIRVAADEVRADLPAVVEELMPMLRRRVARRPA